MAQVIPEATGVVLAGGAGSRFGSNKALAPWRGRQTLVERVCELMSPLFSRVLVVVKDAAPLAFLERPGVALCQDLYAQAHSLGGLCSGLRQAPTERAFVSGCDMPLLAPGLVRALWSAGAGYDAAIPVWRGRPQPLCGVYSKSCLGVIETRARQGRLKLQELFGLVRTRFFIEDEVREWDPRGLSFRDVDTPADLLSAKKELST